MTVIELTLPDELVIPDEVALRQERLTNLARAKAVLEARAQERYAAERASYEAKMREREEKARTNKRKPGGRPSQPPEPGPRDQDQYNFTDPESRIMKNSTNEGFDQHYNVQVAVDQANLLIVATALSNHPNDKREAEPTLTPSRPKSASPRRRHWTMATSVTPICKPSNAGALNPISPRLENRIIRVGTLCSPNSQPHHRKTPARNSKWLTNFRRRSVGPSIACANVPSNPSSASLRKC